MVSQRFGFEFRVPSLADMFEVAATDFDRRQALDVVCALPWEQVSRAIDGGMAEPGFGGCDSAAGGLARFVARVDADAILGRLFIPRQL